MRIETVDLLPATLDDAPAWGDLPWSCRYCLYWEEEEDNVFTPKPGKEEALRRKRDWVAACSAVGGAAGKIAYVDGRPVGYAQFGPPSLFPTAATYDCGPPSADALFLSCLFVPWEEMRRKGIGGSLLDSVIAEARVRGARAVETIARRGSENNPSGPVGLYEQRGFRVVRDDDEFPLMRLDL